MIHYKTRAGVVHRSEADKKTLCGKTIKDDGYSLTTDSVNCRLCLEETSYLEVIDFEQQIRERDARDVSKDKTGRHKGYDVLSTDRAGREQRIEVKYTTTKTWEIPNAYETEYTTTTDGHWLVADWLYVVVFDDGKVDSIHPISQEDVDEHSKKHKEYRKIRFAPKLQTAFRARKFEARLDGRTEE